MEIQRIGILDVKSMHREPCLLLGVCVVCTYVGLVCAVDSVGIRMQMEFLCRA